MISTLSPKSALYRVHPQKTEQSIQSNFQDFALINSKTKFTLLDRASFLHYNNTKIIKFGWELFILWLISCGLSLSGFARFPEFRGTINDSFSSTCANTYQHSISYKEISVPMTCLGCKSLSLNSIVILVRQYTDHGTQYSLNLSWTDEAVINRASELWKSGKSRKWQSIRNYS